MAEITIVREHALGLAKARKIAFRWAELVEAEFGMECVYTEDKGGDTVEFVRPGVKGTLLVTRHGFELRAQLGMLVGAFKQKIESEIVKNLDELLSPTQHKPQARTAAAGRTGKMA